MPVDLLGVQAVGVQLRRRAEVDVTAALSAVVLPEPIAGSEHLPQLLRVSQAVLLLVLVVVIQRDELVRHVLRHQRVAAGVFDAD